MTKPATDWRQSRSTKLISAAVVIGLVGWLYWQYGKHLSITYFAEQETQLIELQSKSPVSVSLVAILVYALVTGLNVPGATALTLVYAWYFKFWLGLVIVSFGSTAGATLSFLISRYWLRDWIQARFADRLVTLNAALEREGAFYLFLLRLNAAVPFFIINPVMGVTKIRLFTFWWVSQLGMLPATIAYVNAGANVPSLQQLADEGVGQVLSWQLLVALAILGLLPLLLKKIAQRWLNPTNGKP